MSDQDEFARILASLYQATLDDRHWPVTSALIDEACGITGNCLLVGEGPPDDIRAMFVGVYARGERQADLEREYLQVYHPIDEAVPRLRQLPDSQLVPIADMYTAEELKTSPSYNDLLRRGHYQQGLNVRLDGPDRSHITWGLGDPVASEGWGSAKIALLQRLLPQIRHFVCVRQALVQAGARATTAAALLENPRIGVIHLDRRGQILEVNDRARRLLRRGQGLSGRDGVLRARQPADRPRLERLVAGALPTAGAVPVSGSMLLGRAAGAPPFVVGPVKFSGSVADLADETRHAELPWISIPTRHYQPRRLAVSPLRCELSRCRRSPGPTRHYGVLRSDPAVVPHVRFSIRSPAQASTGPAGRHLAPGRGLRHHPGTAALSLACRRSRW